MVTDVELLKAILDHLRSIAWNFLNVEEPFVWALTHGSYDHYTTVIPILS